MGDLPVAVKAIVNWVADSRWVGRPPWLVADELERRAGSRSLGLQALGALRSSGHLVLGRPGRLTTPEYAGARPDAPEHLPPDARRAYEAFQRDDCHTRRSLWKTTGMTRERTDAALQRLRADGIVVRRNHKVWTLATPRSDP